MKYLFFCFYLATLCLYSCTKTPETAVHRNDIEGTWQLIYGEVKENDSLTIKDLSKSSFIKIINDSHFAFFNQVEGDASKFYGGGGTYKISGDDYIETLIYTSALDFKDHTFPFKVVIKEDTLIQSGVEEIKEANIKREIIEKYVRIKSSLEQ